jgi:hypothetical protein
MSPRFEKISEDLNSIWLELPIGPKIKKYDKVTFVEVTYDCWFVHISGKWRMMNPGEHIKAVRQEWIKNH